MAWQENARDRRDGTLGECSNWLSIERSAWYCCW